MCVPAVNNYHCSLASKAYAGMKYISVGAILVNNVQALSGDATNCMQEGSIFTYECTVTDTNGIGSTIWSGNAFQCMQSSNQITLTHSRYESGLNSTCGNFSAVSVGTNGSEYTSRLTFFGDNKLNGTTINCTLSNVHLVATIIVIVNG